METVSWRVWLPVAATGMAAVVVATGLFGGDRSAAAINAGRTMTFVDRGTGAVFAGIPRTTPAIHPATGEASLMCGWYCGQCDEWTAGPSPDMVQRSRRPPQCGRCRQTLAMEGPLPVHATRLVDEAASH